MKKKRNMYEIIKNAMIFITMFIITIVHIYIFLIGLKWINILEETKCECSEDNRRYYIKNFIIFYILYIIFTVALYIFGFIALYIIKKLNLVNYILDNNIILIIIGIIVFLISILSICVVFASWLNVIFSITYINYLDVKKCKCSQTKSRDLYYMWNILLLVFIIINIIRYFVNIK